MPEASQGPEKANPVPLSGDHDRVIMLSLKADGTADQHNPEIIGDVEVAIAAALEQFGQQAVSAVDVAERGVSSSQVTLVGQADGSSKEVPLTTEPDKATAELARKHEAAQKAGRAAAEKAITALAKKS